MQNKTIGQNIKALRGKLRLTQENLAEYLGIDRVNISYYENCERRIPVVHLNKLADLFGVELHDLLTEDLVNQSLNVSFAFRATNLTNEDLQNIAQFKRIVKNYLKLVDLKNKNEQ